MSRKEDREIQAEQAGEKYADDQINSDPFMDWVWEQLVEASRMDPSEVLPLKTKADALVVARNILQQLEWDAKRDLDGGDIARLLVIDIAEREDIRAFFDGFERSTSTWRDWLAENILTMSREIGGGGVSEARRSGGRGRPPKRQYASPVRYTSQQLAWFDIADIVRDLESTKRNHPDWAEQPNWAEYIADLERSAAKKKAAFLAAYGVAFEDWSAYPPGEGVEEARRRSPRAHEVARGPAHVKRIALKSERRKDRLGGSTRTVWVIYDVDTGDTISASTNEQAERERFQHYTSGEVFDGGVAYEDASGGSRMRERPESVEDPFYIIQGIYAGGGGVISDSFGFDDEATARAEAEKLLKSPHFEGDYVRIITRDGELVWDSQEEASRGARRRRRSSGAQPETGFQVKLLEGGWVHVPSFEAASAAISAERDRLGVGASAWKRDTGHVVDAQGRLVAHISYNGRIWPEGSKYGPRESTSRRARRR